MIFYDEAYEGNISPQRLGDTEKKVKKMKRSEKQDPLTYQIIGAGIEVHKVLGPGLLERVYEDAICIELAERKLQYERQKLINLQYKGHIIGDLVADLIIEERVIVELKAVERLLPVHTAQLMTYLKLTNLNLGLLMNFNIPVLTDGVKRIIL